jgi:hypothetical protein
MVGMHVLLKPVRRVLDMRVMFMFRKCAPGYLGPIQLVSGGCYNEKIIREIHYEERRGTMQRTKLESNGSQ